MRRSQQTLIEWTFVSLMVTVSAALSILQYQWTGTMGEAEASHLRSSLDGRLQQLRAAVDGEIERAVTVLKPDAKEIDRKGVEAAHEDRYRLWAEGNGRPLFRQICVAVPTGAAMELWRISEDGRLVRQEWPAEWASLRDQFWRKSQGSGEVPRVADGSDLIEAPVFSSNGGNEREWLLLELDEEYLRNTWLPELVSAFLDPSLNVQILADRREVFRMGLVTPPVDASTSIFPREAMGQPEGPGGRGRGRGRGPGRGRGDREAGRWTLNVKYRAGSLDTVVRTARMKNFAIALAMNLLILAAGIALVSFTRRSRMLAARQLEFAAGVSHELRTPLTVIRGAGHNLLAGVVREPDKVERYARAIVQHADQLTDMIEQLLSFARLQKPQAPAQRVATNLSTAIDQGLAAAAAEVESSGCKLDVRIDDPTATVMADPVGLRRVFQNLISNAARHAAQGKWIGVEASRRDGRIEVQVMDRGPGIPEHELERVFEPFYRGENARADHVRGTGLGLSLVKSIVEEHGGTVVLQRRAEGGLEFTVRLPEIPKGEYDEFAHSDR